MADSHGMLLRVLMLGLLLISASSPCTAFCAQGERGLVTQPMGHAAEAEAMPPCHGAEQPQRPDGSCPEGCDQCPPNLSATLDSQGSFQRAHLLSAPVLCRPAAHLAPCAPTLRPASAVETHAPPARRILHLKSSLLI